MFDQLFNQLDKLTVKLHSKPTNKNLTFVTQNKGGKNCVLLQKIL